MATASLPTMLLARRALPRSLTQTVRAHCARLMETRRQRQAHERMLNAVEDLDHPGVHADIRAACGAWR